MRDIQPSSGSAVSPLGSERTLEAEIARAAVHAVHALEHVDRFETQRLGAAVADAVDPRAARKLDLPTRRPLANRAAHSAVATLTDAQYHEALLCVQSGSNLNDPKRFKFDNDQFYLKTAREMRELFKDIPEALVDPSLLQNLTELRVHFHLPLHSEPVNKDFSNTTDFLKKVIGTIKGSTTPACELEIETYTWEVLPPSLRSKNVTDQIVSEYRWVLSELAQQRIEPA